MNFDVSKHSDMDEPQIEEVKKNFAESPLLEGIENPEKNPSTSNVPSYRVINEVGGDGNYQKLVLIGFLLPAIGIFLFASAFQNLTLIPNFLCQKTFDEKSNYFSCQIAQVCSKNYNIKIDEKSSLNNWVYDFNFYCDYETVQNYLIVMLGIGVIIGSALFISLGDRFGRKILLVISSFCSAILSLVTIFLHSVFLLEVICLLQGILMTIFMALFIVYMVEISSINARASYASYALCSLPISGIVNELIMHISNSWKITFVVNIIFILVMVFYLMYIVESPRFLISRGEYSYSKVHLLLIAKCNRKQITEISIQGENMTVNPEYLYSQDLRNNNLFIMLELFSPNNLIKSITIFAQSFCLSILFAGIGFVSIPLFQSIYFNNLFNYTLDIINIILTGFLIWFLGRKYAIFLGVIISAGLTILSFFFGFISEMYYGAAIWLTRIFCVASFTANKIYCIELFPTRVRSSGASIVFFASGIGIIASFYLSKIPLQIQYIFGILGLFSIFIMTYLVETNGVELKEDFNDRINEKSMNNEGLDLKINQFQNYKND